MSEYTNRLVVICPERFFDIGNHLACVLGESIHDLKSFDYPNLLDDSGNEYQIVSALIKPIVLQSAGSALVRPYFDVDSVIDMAKASQAQALIQWDYLDVANKLSSALDVTIDEAITAAGLTRRQVEL